MEGQIDISLIVGIVIAMCFSAFFSGMEIAFVSSNRMLAEMEKGKNGMLLLSNCEKSTPWS